MLDSYPLVPSHSDPRHAIEVGPYRDVRRRMFWRASVNPASFDERPCWGMAGDGRVSRFTPTTRHDRGTDTRDIGKYIERPLALGRKIELQVPYDEVQLKTLNVC
jgi:hypothetical protein